MCYDKKGRILKGENMMNNNKSKKSLKILISCVVIILIILGVILTVQLIYRSNQKVEEEIIAKNTEITIGDKDVLYVDLTQDSATQEQINTSVEGNKVENEPVDNNTNALDQINQDYFDMEFDLDSGTALVDGNEIDIADLFDITEEQEKELISSEDNFYNYLNDNITGDVEYEDGNIKVENPYSTNTIIMQTANLTEIQNGGDIQSIKKLADDIYTVHYENAEDTKEGYNILKEDDLVNNISTDIEIELLDDIETENSVGTTVDTLGISNNNYAWGISSTGLRTYTNKLNYGQNETEVKVAVFDSRVRTTHEVFANETTADRLDTTHSYNYVDDNNDISDDNGHGTMVAGIIAQSTSNNVKIVPVKILRSDGKGILSDALEGLSTITNYVDVINLSLGVDKNELDSGAMAITESVFRQIYNSGKAVICASGNDGEENVLYPASSEYTIAVSAIDINDNISSFSNYGDTVDFAAPGEGLILPYYTGDNLYNADFEPSSEEYQMNSGTSFAAPFVSAAVALIKAENTNYTISQIEDLLIDNSEDLGTAGKDKYYGYGGINFNNNMFSKPVIANVDVTNEWATKNTIEAYAVCGKPIVSWAFTDSQATPSDSAWKDFESEATTVQIEIILQQNKDVYIWFKDESGNIINQKVTVAHVDITNPKIVNELTASLDDATNFTAKVSVQDSQSGLSRIDWYYKKQSDTNYTKVTDTYATTGTGETNNIEKVHQFSNLEENTTYSIYAEIYDMAGNFIKTKEVTVNTLEDDDNDDNNNTNTGIGDTNIDNNTNTGSNTNTDTGNNTNTNIDNNTNTDTGNNTNTNIDNNTNTDTGNNTNTDTGNNTNTNIDNNTNTDTGNNTNTNIDNNTNTDIGNNTNTNYFNTENQTGNNSYIVGGMTGNSSGTNRIQSKLDNTTASTNLPKTGNNRIVIIFIIVVLISGVFTYVKYKKMKDVK